MQNRLGIVAAAVMLATTALVLQGRPSATSSEDDANLQGIPGSVAFNSSRDGNPEIYTMDADGGSPTRITDAASNDVDPAISPNGNDIAFTSSRTGNNDIFLVGSGGGTPANLTDHPANDGWARWSPDGHQIVFHSNRDGNFELYVMNADGTSPTRLTDYPGVDQYPDWSPDGKKIAFRRDTDIYVLDLTIGEAARLTNTPPFVNQMPAWSPNGRRIVFASLRDGYPSVFTMDADGGRQVNRTPKGDGDLASVWMSRAPSWSRNGRRIYFMSFRPSTGGDTEVFVMNADGSGVRRLTETLGVDGSPRPR